MTRINKVERAKIIWLKLKETIFLKKQTYMFGIEENMD